MLFLLHLWPFQSYEYLAIKNKHIFQEGKRHYNHVAFRNNIIKVMNVLEILSPSVLVSSTCLSTLLIPLMSLRIFLQFLHSVMRTMLFQQYPANLKVSMLP